MNLILIGPPGAGKGTQAIQLCQRFSLQHLSTGAMLRDAAASGSALGQRVAQVMASGGLVSDALIIQLVRTYISSATPDRSGLLLDGFPRTVAQAEALDELINPLAIAVVQLVVDEQAVVQRLSRRRTCRACGATYARPERRGLHRDRCTACGGRLIQREDDAPDVIRQRLRTYASVSRPVVHYYRYRRGYIEVDGLQTPEMVTAALVDVLAGWRDGRQ